MRNNMHVMYMSSGNKCIEVNQCGFCKNVASLSNLSICSLFKLSSEFDKCEVFDKVDNVSERVEALFNSNSEVRKND